jgi:hypothetical protein
MSILDKIVTPAFVAFQAHCWFAYAVVFTLSLRCGACEAWIVAAALTLAALKEFYIDKHFEADQSFDDNLRDFGGYASGVVVALFVSYL